LASRSTHNKEFDYIIAGAGCAGLSLAMHGLETGLFRNKRVLVVDRDAKKANDRTWCFWEKGEGLFEPIVHHRWKTLQFHSSALSRELAIDPYSYKMIRGADFYAYCLDRIRRQPNFTFYQDSVSHVFSTKEATGIVIGEKAILCDYVFNSIPPPPPPATDKTHWLLQHFMGWVIETPAPAFDPGAATLMDFRIAQDKGTAFCYVLPVSPTRALVEYTLFSQSLLEKEAYREGLKQYISHYIGLTDYAIAEEEFGIIPMTNHRFSPGHHRQVNLGTAGGQTKGSSGYTFQFIQKHSRSLVRDLAAGRRPALRSIPLRFRFYDSVLLRILRQETLPGHHIFSELFRRNRASLVLKFLDNETSPAEELRIISSLPTAPFLKAAIHQVF
jgi:lycopene beta-cyclase